MEQERAFGLFMKMMMMMVMMMTVMMMMMMMMMMVFRFFCNPVFNVFQSCIPIVFSIGTLENV